MPISRVPVVRARNSRRFIGVLNMVVREVYVRFLPVATALVTRDVTDFLNLQPTITSTGALVSSL